MWKLIILGIAVYVLYRLFANDFLRKNRDEEKKAKEEKERKIAAGEMVKDPQCGTYVSMDDSISVKDGNQTYYFCSYECRDEFLKELEAGGRTLPPHGDKSDES